MRFLLDTNIAIHLRDGDAEISARVVQLGGQILLSIISQIELAGGVYRFPTNQDSRRQRAAALTDILTVLDFDRPCAEAYERILQAAGYSRRKLLDRMIAAQALVHGLTLVTANPSDFNDIPGLSILAW